MTPSAPDGAIVRRHLLALDAAVTTLRTHQGLPLERLTADTDERWAVERGLQLCAQGAIDLATHIAASAGNDVPNYAVAIDHLGRMGVLPPEFAASFRRIAGIRNILVHGYLAVDPQIVHTLLNEQLDDFVTYAEHVQRHVDGEDARDDGDA